MACNEKNPLQLGGTSQYQRQLKALDPTYAPVDELCLNEWLSFAYHYAASVNYFPINNADYPQGDWQAFFKDPGILKDFIAEAELKISNASAEFPDSSIASDIEPHLALFMSFLLLLQHSKNALNQFTGRHLDFYFKQVLQLRNRKEVPDKVHVIYELARNISSAKLEQGTLLDADKDSSEKSKPLQYKTNSELVVNNAKIASIRSLYKTSDKIQYADATFSVDGLGTPFKDELPKWNAFGNDGWPVALMGFSVASKLLLLKEGTRKITLTLTFKSAVTLPDVTKLPEVFNVFLTGAAGWIQGQFPALLAFQYTAATNKLVITVNLPATEKPVVAYDKTLHQQNYITDLPVMRLVVQATGVGFTVYEALSKAELCKIALQVNVEDMKDLIVENDQGRLDASKPFLAFGSQPRVGSNLYIGNAEIFQKTWVTITAKIEWKNVPEDLVEHYNAYRNNYVKKSLSRNNYLLTTDNESTLTVGGGRFITSKDDFKATATYLKDGKWYPEAEDKKTIKLLENTFTLSKEGVSQPLGSAMIAIFTYFTMQWSPPGNSASSNSNTQNASLNAVNQAASATSNSNQQYTQHSNEDNYLNYYLSGNAANVYYANPGLISVSGINSNVQTQSANFSASTKDDFIRISLQQDFLHRIYPQLYAVAMTIQGGLIPKEPYTPEIAGITLGYSASTETDVSDLGNSTITNTQRLANYTARSIQFFHETSFGQAEQHIFLKDQYTGLDKRIMTLPQVPDLADLYIGLDASLPDSIVSLLFQVSEGSENPLAPVITEELKPVWYFLSGNEWLKFDKKRIIGDDTNYFLRSGIIKLMLPAESTTNNTYLNQNLRWLRVSLPAGLSINSVSKFINIHIQAGQAVFFNQSNNLAHLEKGLQKGTIKKLADRIPQIKTVSQQYASFGGSLPENDQTFRQRVSERLRHKHRAINIWDYERLVLAKFPGIYKVRCLNHTNNALEVAPGSVRIIVIPDIRNQNSFDPFQPRVSMNTLSEIKAYLVRLMSLHVDLEVENPKYESVTFNFNVQFYPQYDKNEYRTQLNNDIIRYLSPWAFDQMAEITLGGSIHKSQAIHFVENLPYVDYVADFRFYFTGSPGNPDELRASNSRAILVSAEKHNISTSIIACT